jgi:type I restriction enzyme S subunit
LVPSTVPPANVNQHVCIVRPSGAVVPRFLAWCLQSEVVQNQVLELQVGGNRDGLNFEQVGNLEIPSKSVEEQRAIADFLDVETARIDTLIEKKRRMVVRLSERSDAALLHFALDGWTAGPRVPIKRVVRHTLNPPRFGDEILTAYRDGQVTSRLSRRSEGYTLADNESTYLHVDEGDLVFHGLDGFAGAVGVAEMSGKCSPVYHVCKVQEPHLAKFLAFQLRALALAGYVELQASSVRQRAVDLRNWERFGALEVVIPAPQTQSAVAHALHDVRERSALIGVALNKQLAMLVERRTAVITGAVTRDSDTRGIAR